MGTIGGNLCLDTRCTYYDQTEEWRRAIGYCMKKDGQTCWVATSSPRCLAVSSTDTAPVLQALGAERAARVRRRRRARCRRGSLRQRRHALPHAAARRDPHRVHVPDQSGWSSTYWKLRRRGSFDFPVAAVAAAIVSSQAARSTDMRLVLGAVASRPLASRRPKRSFAASRLTDDASPPRPTPPTRSPSRWTTPTSSSSGARK